MVLEWNDYQTRLISRIGEIGKLSPYTMRGYKALSIARHGDGCITVHTDAAARHGATVEKIAEALGVAIAVNAGAALAYLAWVMDAFSVKHP